MSDDKKLTTGKLIGLIAVALTTVVLVLWGVPYYLKAEVHDLFIAELKASPHPVTTNDLAAVVAVGSAVQLQLTSMETRMIARDKLFMDYLKDQANRGSDSSSGGN